jgi:hypothetical protein
MSRGKKGRKEREGRSRQETGDGWRFIKLSPLGVGKKGSKIPCGSF